MSRTWPGRSAAFACLACVVLLAGCAPGQEFLNNGQKLIDQGYPEEGLAQMERAAGAEPGNSGYRMTLVREREVQTNLMLTKADAALRAGRPDDAASLYERANTLWPDHPRALAGRVRDLHITFQCGSITHRRFPFLPFGPLIHGCNRAKTESPHL